MAHKKKKFKSILINISLTLYIICIASTRCHAPVLSDFYSNKAVSSQCLRSNPNHQSRPWEKCSDMLVR